LNRIEIVAGGVVPREKFYENHGITISQHIVASDRLVEIG